MDIKLGTIKHFSLKKGWSHETDFSDWLADQGLEEISKLIGISLCDAKREVSVGLYKADIVAHEEDSDRLVLIENQYNTVNHDHLGKLITYSAGIGAQTAVLIVEDIRPEAATTIRWLNEISRDNFAFYLIKAELIQIDNSAFAPKFTVAEAPDKLVRETRAEVNELSGLEKDRKLFWQNFNRYAETREDFMKVFNTKKPSANHWMDFPCGSSDYHLAMAIQCKPNELISAEVYINKDKEFYHRFHDKKAQIEADCGFTFDWKELPNRTASRIIITKLCKWQTGNEQAEGFKWLCDHILTMRKVFPSYA